MGTAILSGSSGDRLPGEEALRAECKKGNRSVTYIIRNDSRCSLQLDTSFTDELWVREPVSIAAGTEVTFAARSNSIMNGVEGKVVFGVEVHDDGPICSALHLTFQVPLVGYSKFTKRAPSYLLLRMQNSSGNHPRVQLTVEDNSDEASGVARGEEVSRYIQEQEAGFEH